MPLRVTSALYPKPMMASEGTGSGDREFINDVKIFVGNLPFTVTPDELKHLFSEAGNILGINIRSDRGTGRSKGFAFVTFESAEQAHRAITTMNGRILGGRELTVSSALKRGLKSESAPSEDSSWVTVSSRRTVKNSARTGKSAEAAHGKSWTSWAGPPGTRSLFCYPGIRFLYNRILSL